MTIECDLCRSLHKGEVRLTGRYIDPCVRLGSHTCGNFLGTAKRFFLRTTDVTNTCSRAKALRAQPPIDELVTKKAS